MPPNPISMRDYLEASVQNLHDLFDARFGTLEESFRKLELAVTKHIEAPDVNHKAAEKRIAALESYKANLEGKFWAFGIAFTGVMAVIQVALRFLLK